MWNIIKDKATETVEALRPSLPSLPIPSSLSRLISHPTPTPKIKEAMQNAPPKKTIEELKKEEEQKKFQKAWDFVTSNEALFKDLMPKIEEYLERRKKSPTNGLKTDAEVKAERDRLVAIIFKTAELELVDEIQWAIEDEIYKVENRDNSKTDVKYILKQVWRNLKRIIRATFFPFLALLFASFVANEMIIYPAPIRLAFFLFTAVICFLSRTILVVVGMFYLCKWGYSYYVNEMSDGPKRLIMPTLFAFLPLTTREYPNRFKNFFARPFQYGERWSKRDARELDTRMELYQASLKDSFPFIEAIKTQEPYQGRLQKIQKNFSELHKEMAPPTAPLALLPPVIAAPAAAAPAATAAEPPLPPVIAAPAAAAPAAAAAAPEPPLPPVIAPVTTSPPPPPPSSQTAPPPEGPPPSFNSVASTEPARGPSAPQVGPPPPPLPPPAMNPVIPNRPPPAPIPEPSA
jgi:hypothetical protein